MNVTRIAAVRHRGALVAIAGLSLLALPAFGQSGDLGHDEFKIRADGPADDTSRPQRVPKVKGIKVLFSGKAKEIADNWIKVGSTQPAPWKIEHGALVAGGGDIGTKEKFEDYQLHIEFKVPYMPDAKGQGRGNSGVFMQSRYEIQLLDSYGFKEPGTGDCGAVYSQAAPLVNACKPPRQWQTYDIVFHEARLDGTGKVTEPARVTVIQNGITVQNNTVIIGVTGGAEDPKEGTPGRIKLQDHGNPMQFRNIWIMPLPKEIVKHYEPK
jgi:hypothetical protein